MNLNNLTDGSDDIRDTFYTDDEWEESTLFSIEEFILYSKQSGITDEDGVGLVSNPETDENGYCVLPSQVIHEDWSCPARFTHIRWFNK